MTGMLFIVWQGTSYVRTLQQALKTASGVGMHGCILQVCAGLSWCCQACVEYAPCAPGRVLIPQPNKVHSSQQRCHKLTERPVQPGVYCYQYLVDGTWMTSPDVPVGPDDDGHLCNKARSRAWPGCASSSWAK